MFFLGLYLGYQSVSKPGPYLRVLQSYWNLHMWNRKEALFLSSVSRCLGLAFGRVHKYSHGVCDVGKNKITVISVASAWSSLWTVEVAIMSYVGSRITLTRKTCGCFELSIRFVGPLCPDAHPLPVAWCERILVDVTARSPWAEETANDTTTTPRAGAVDGERQSNSHDGSTLHTGHRVWRQAWERRSNCYSSGSVRKAESSGESKLKQGAATFPVLRSHAREKMSKPLATCFVMS